MHHVARTLPALVMAVVVALAAAGCGRNAGSDSPMGGGTTGVRVTDVTLGRTVGGDRTITDQADTFRPNDTIHASVATEGSAANATLRARWTYEGGQVVNESTESIAPTGRAATAFHISKPDGWPAGKYTLQVYLNDQLAETKNFTVRQ
jgi:hypothetical protein